ncbi:MAG TPA: response regulator [Lysobacter sp.]|nr:response regulator [Lysobacter sp.]
MEGIEGLRLLLVEDEYVLALGLADVLGDLGAIVLGPVATVDDALALVERVPEIDGAVLDVNLGQEVAYPVADALIARGIPFLFATANDRTRLPERFSRVAVCQKPFEVEAFRQAVAALPSTRIRRVA